MGAQFLRAASIVVLWTALALAAPGPVLSLERLLQESDAAVVGRIANITEAGDTVANGVPARRVVGMILVDEVLLGVLPDSNVRVTFLQPEAPGGVRGVAVDTYGLFFLRRSADGFQFTSQLYPYVVALPDFRTSAQSPIDRVFDTVSNVLRADGLTTAKLEALSTLRGSSNAFALRALRESTRDRDQEVALRAAAALLSVDDLSGMPLISGTLEGNRGGLSEETYVTVLGSISGLHASAALPEMERLLSRGEARTRKAAAAAVRNIRSHGSIPSLIRALDDDDAEVRYLAVMTLAEVTGQTNGAPSVPTFAANERQYITYWKEWARRR